MQLAWFNSPVYAEDKYPLCANSNANVIPDGHPTTPLIGTDRKATFEITVGDVNTYSGWKMWFNCGGQGEGNTVDASEDINKIFYELEKTGMNPCEFAEGPHTIKIMGVDQSDNKIPHCTAKYTVFSTLKYYESLCNINIEIQNSDPDNKKDITTDTKLVVRVTDLPKKNDKADLYYTLFVDNEPSKITFQGNTGTTPYVIPPKYMSESIKHNIGVRRITNTDAGVILPFCKASYTVGTTSKPGSITSTPSSTGDGAPSICKTNPTSPECSKGGGEPCDPDDKRGPGFKTAIGCIHTNPTELVKDFMKFGVGIGGGLAFLMMLLGAFQMLTSAGNPETLNAGKDRLTSAVIGLLFVIFSVLLLKIIGVDILGLGGQFGYKL